MPICRFSFGAALDGIFDPLQIGPSQTCRAVSLPQTDVPDPTKRGSVEMLADELDYVVGVDTHRDQHVLAVVAAPSGAVVAQRSIRADAGGYREALRFADRHARGVRVWAIEGAGHYGPGLARFLSQHAERLHEVSRTSRGGRRLRGKDDPLDAVRAARTGLASETTAIPRSGSHQEALRVLLLARRSAVDVRRVALVQLRSLIVTAPENLRQDLRRLRSASSSVAAAAFAVRTPALPSS
jgi:hypothetical protein